MLEMRLEPISSVRHVEEAANMAQLVTLFALEFDEGDFQYDDDALLQSYLEALREEGEADLADHLEGERLQGISDAKERLLSDVRSLMRTRLGALGDHAPFSWDMKSSHLLSRKSLDIDGVGAAYLWLCLFDLSEGEGDYLQVDKDQMKSFRAVFDDVFEVITCYAIAGRSEQYTWYAGKHRSAPRFLKFLHRVTKAAGSGKVKALADLDANQQSVNDAGVDGLGLSLHEGKVRNDAALLITQATIQKTNRRIKLIGADEIKRFKALFINQILAAAQGALVIPYEGTAIDKANCAEQDCVYITKAEVYTLMGRHPAGPKRPGQQRLDAVMKRYSLEYLGQAILSTVDGALSIA